MWSLNRLTASLFVYLLAIAVSAGAPPTPTWFGSMRGAVMALGWLFMVIMGIKWTLADNPDERADAKKGLMYIMIGLLVVNAVCGIACMFCHIGCQSLGPPGIKCHEVAMMDPLGCPTCPVCT